MSKGETQDRKGFRIRPLARMGLRKSAVDLAAEPPLSPMAPVDLDDDTAVAEVLNLALEIGSVLIACGEGAADSAVQVKSVAAAYGLPGAMVEVTFTTLSIGVNRRRGRPPVQVMRVVDYRTVDLTRLTRVARLIDRIVRRQVTVVQATDEVQRIVEDSHPHSFPVAVFGWAMLAFGVVIQLGGHPVAGLLSMVSTFALMYVNRSLSLRGLPTFFQQFTGGFIAAAWAVIAYAVLDGNGFSVNPSQLVAAGIIVLLAGLTMVGAIEDAITGYPVTAAGRGVETVMLTGGVLGGITLALVVLNRVGITPPPIDPSIYGANPVVVTTLAAGVGAAGFAIASYATVKATAVGGVIGCLAMLLYTGVTVTGLGAVAAAGMSAAATGLIGGIVARLATLPPLVVTIAGITPLLPGLSVYRGLSALTANLTGTGLGLIFQALAVAVALAAGVVFGEWITRTLRRSEAASSVT